MIVVFGYNLNIVSIFLSTDEKLISGIYIWKEIAGIVQFRLRFDATETADISKYPSSHGGYMTPFMRASYCYHPNSPNSFNLTCVTLTTSGAPNEDIVQNHLT